ncbi:hypothetical protein DXG01_011246 [Tephrocybe rancida]|nr:hypothetical protein DXG01_011246 [Tephrocybe rancida]
MSSSAMFIEQRPPFIIQLASRVPTYTYVLISVLAMLLFMAIPSLTIAKPPVRVLSRKPRRKSLTTTTPITDTTEADIKAIRPTLKGTDSVGNEKAGHVSFSETFSKLGSSMRTALPHRSSFKPIARRLSIPARRFSSQLVVALHHFTPAHHHHHGDADSYFVSTSKKSANAQVEVVKDAAVSSTEQGNVCIDKSESITAPAPPTDKAAPAPEPVIVQAVVDAASVTPQVASASHKKSATFKRVARRASIVLGIGRR